jgi:uncharacterized protein with ParB-like and HNH nuclease domain
MKKYLAQPYHYPICNFIIWQKNDILILKPEYQRDFCWTQEQQIKLIDSIYRGIPLPSVFIREVQLKSKTMYEVIDGQQRLTTILNYINGVFVYPEYPYSEKFLSRAVLLTYQMHNLDDAEVIELYNRLNFAGTPHERDTI